MTTDCILLKDIWVLADVEGNDTIPVLSRELLMASNYYWVTQQSEACHHGDDTMTNTLKNVSIATGMVFFKCKHDVLALSSH
jgi:hypothetical protein